MIVDAQVAAQSGSGERLRCVGEALSDERWGRQLGCSVVVRADTEMGVAVFVGGELEGERVGCG